MNGNDLNKDDFKPKKKKSSSLEKEKVNSLNDRSLKRKREEELVNLTQLRKRMKWIKITDCNKNNLNELKYLKSTPL